MAGFNLGSAQAYLKLNTMGWTRGIGGANASLQALSRTSMKIGAALIAKTALITREYGKFDKAIRHATSVSELSQEQFKTMSNMALDASVAWNKAAADTAQAFYYLGSAGLTATEQMQAFNDTIMLSRAMGSDLSQTVEGLVDIVRAFGLEFENTSHIADILTKTVISSNQHFSDLDKALSYAGATAAFTNNTLEETTAMLGVMANAGIKGSMAGTVLRRAIANLVAPTAEMSEIMYELGLNVYDSEGKMKPFIDILGEMNETMAGTSEEYRNMVFKVLFGVRAIGGQVALFNYGADALKNYTGEIKNAGEVTESVAMKQMKAFTEQIGRLWQQVRRVAIVLGGLLAPNIEALADKLRDGTTAIENWVEQNKEAVASSLKWIGLIGAIGLAIPLVAGVAGALLSLINPFTVVLFTLYSLRTLWADYFGGDGELAKSLKEFGNALTDFVNGAFTKAMEKISEKIEKIKKDHEVLAAFLKLGQVGAATVAGTGKAIGWGLKTSAYGYAELGALGYKGLEGLKRQAWQLRDSMTEGQREMLYGRDTRGWGYSYGVYGKPTLGQATSNLGRTLLKKESEQLAADFDNYMKPLWEKIEGYLPEGLKGTLDNLKGMVDAYKNGVKDITVTVVDETEKMMDKLEEGTLNTGKAVNKSLQTISAGWKAALHELYQPTEGFLEKWKDKFVNVLGDIQSSWSNTINDLISNTSQGALTFKNIMTDMFDAVRLSFNRLVADMAANDLMAFLTGQKPKEGMPSLFYGENSVFQTLLRGLKNLFTPTPLQGDFPSPGDSGLRLAKAALGGNTTVNVINQTTQPVAAKTTGQTWDGKSWVVDVVLEEMQINRAFAKAVRG